ncbi:E3 SUMO-protein ligase ZBED1-like isoform 2-T2 [Polymixia lowei]
MDLISKPRSKSSIWMYFGLKADAKGQPFNTDEIICRLCRKVVLAKGGNTTNLRSHLKRRHRADFSEPASSSCPGTVSVSQGFDLGQEVAFDDFPALQMNPNQNYIKDAVLSTGEPWLHGGPSRAMLSLPSCLRLWREPVTGGMAGQGFSSEERGKDLRVYANYHLQQGLIFGPFVGEVARGQLHTSLQYAWAIRDDAAFYYIDASDENQSNWMRYVTYASSEEDCNLIVFQFYRHIYYRVSQPISEGAELKVWIGKDYAGMLGLGMDENMRYDVGDKEMILRIFQDIQVVTLPEPNSSSIWSENSQSQNPMPIISEVTSISTPDATVDSGMVSASSSSSSSLASFPFAAPHQLEKYDFIPGAEKLLSHPNTGRKGQWRFFGFEPDPTGQPLDPSVVVCKICGEHVGCRDMQTHLINKHDIRPRDIVKGLKDRSPLTSGQRLQAPILSSCLDMAALPPTVPQITAQTTNAIANFIIRDLHPTAMVEGEGFKQLIHTLLPSYKELPSACLLGRLLKDLHTKSKKSLAQLLRRKTGSGDEEDISNYTASIEVKPRSYGRPPRSQGEVPHFVTLSVDVWFHEWQGDTKRYATLWAHYIDANFSFQNLALSTQRLAETEAGDYSPSTVEAQVKVMAQEWGISRPSLVLLGGEGSEKMKLGLRNKNSRVLVGRVPHPSSTTFLEREDSVSSDELQGQEHGHPSSEVLPFIPCFFSTVQCCVEEVMSHPVISKTLGLFQRVLSTLFPLHPENSDPSQQHIQSLLLTMPRHERAQLKSWAHSRPSWNKLYSLLHTLVKHQNLVCDMTKEIKSENLIGEIAIDPIPSESTTADNSYATSSNSILAPRRSEWKVLEELCLVLKPLDVACQTLAKEAFPRLSLIKPILTGLLTRHLASRPGDSSAILKEVKKMMRQNLTSCYDNPVVNRVLCVACSLDPQFHGLGFMEEQTATFDWLKKEAVRIVKEDKWRCQAGKQSHNKRSPSPFSSESDGDCLRRSKRLKDTPPINFKELEDMADDESDPGEADPGSQGGLLGMEFLLGDLFGSTPQNRQSSVEESVDIEMSVFRAGKGATLGVEPLQWWRTKAGQFPLLATVARAYLAAPAVAGSAAQDFLLEGGATYRKRTNIPPESLDEILFLHHNRMPVSVLGQPAER